jgi:hypothetical protein
MPLSKKFGAFKTLWLFVRSSSWNDIPRWNVDLTTFPNLNILNQNSNYCSVLVYEWPKLSQQQKHIEILVQRMMKVEEPQKDENVNKEGQNNKQ